MLRTHGTVITYKNLVMRRFLAYLTFCMYARKKVGRRGYLHHVNQNEIEQCKRQCTFRRLIPCEDCDINDLCLMIMRDRYLTLPIDAWEALDLYLVLRNEIKALL